METFDKLLAIRNNLESKALLQAWSLRETDLYSFQRQLDRIDEGRAEDGTFVDGAGVVGDLQTQRVWPQTDDPSNVQTLLYLLRKSYALIYRLLTASEPVSEALLPIYSQLKTLRKCLREVKKAGGVSSPRELYPYTMKVSASGFGVILTASSLPSTTCGSTESSWSTMRCQMGSPQPWSFWIAASSL
jgi:hypothetical protein